MKKQIKMIHKWLYINDSPYKSFTGKYYVTLFLVSLPIALILILISFIFPVYTDTIKLILTYIFGPIFFIFIISLIIDKIIYRDY